MKKLNIIKKPIVLLGLIASFIAIITITVFAAYSFRKTIVDEDVTVGDVTVDSKSYLSYSKYSDSYIVNTLGFEPYTTSYYVAKKIRIDTVCLLEDIQMKASYSPVSITEFHSGVTYYTYDSTRDSYSIASTYESGVTYYVASYGLSGVKNSYDIAVNRLTTEVDNNIITVYEYGTTNTIAIITVTVDSINGVLTGITSVVKSNTTEGTLKAIIGSDKLSITVIDSSLVTGTNVPSRISQSNNKVTCYANYRNKEDSRIDYTLPYLSQLGLEFTFTAKIPVYVRIHIQDAWISERIISSTRSRTKYVLKDQISGSSPFAVTNDSWYYDSATNIVYLKTLYTPVYTVDSTTGEYNYESMSVIFDVNEGYYYYDTSPTASQTYTTVEVSFTVDIVQANRAAALWGSDFTKIFG